MNTQENDNDGEWHFSEESIKKADLPTWEWDKQQNNSVDSKSSSNSSMNQSSSSQKKSQDEIQKYKSEKGYLSDSRQIIKKTAELISSSKRSIEQPGDEKREKSGAAISQVLDANGLRISQQPQKMFDFEDFACNNSRVSSASQRSSDSERVVKKALDVLQKSQQLQKKNSLKQNSKNENSTINTTEYKHNQVPVNQKKDDFSKDKIFDLLRKTSDIDKSTSSLKERERFNDFFDFNKYNKDSLKKEENFEKMDLNSLNIPNCFSKSNTSFNIISENNLNNIEGQEKKHNTFGIPSNQESQESLDIIGRSRGITAQFAPHFDLNPNFHHHVEDNIQSNKILEVWSLGDIEETSNNTKEQKHNQNNISLNHNFKESEIQDGQQDKNDAKFDNLFDFQIQNKSNAIELSKSISSEVKESNLKKYKQISHKERQMSLTKSIFGQQTQFEAGEEEEQYNMNKPAILQNNKKAQKKEGNQKILDFDFLNQMFPPSKQKPIDKDQEKQKMNNNNELDFGMMPQIQIPAARVYKEEDPMIQKSNKQNSYLSLDLGIALSEKIDSPIMIRKLDLQVEKNKEQCYINSLTNIDKFQYPEFSDSIVCDNNHKKVIKKIKSHNDIRQDINWEKNNNKNFCASMKYSNQNLPQKKQQRKEEEFKKGKEELEQQQKVDANVSNNKILSLCDIQNYNSQEINNLSQLKQQRMTPTNQNSKMEQIFGENQNDHIDKSIDLQNSMSIQNNNKSRNNKSVNHTSPLSFYTAEERFQSCKDSQFSNSYNEQDSFHSVKEHSSQEQIEDDNHHQQEKIQNQENVNNQNLKTSEKSKQKSKETNQENEIEDANKQKQYSFRPFVLTNEKKMKSEISEIKKFSSIIKPPTFGVLSQNEIEVKNLNDKQIIKNNKLSGTSNHIFNQEINFQDEVIEQEDRVKRVRKVDQLNMGNQRKDGLEQKTKQSNFMGQIKQQYPDNNNDRQTETQQSGDSSINNCKINLSELKYEKNPFESDLENSSPQSLKIIPIVPIIKQLDANNDCFVIEGENMIESELMMSSYSNQIGSSNGNNVEQISFNGMSPIQKISNNSNINNVHKQVTKPTQFVKEEPNQGLNTPQWSGMNFQNKQPSAKESNGSNSNHHESQKKKNNTLAWKDYPNESSFEQSSSDDSSRISQVFQKEFQLIEQKHQNNYRIDQNFIKTKQNENIAQKKNSVFKRARHFNCEDISLPKYQQSPENDQNQLFTHINPRQTESMYSLGGPRDSNSNFLLTEYLQSQNDLDKLQIFNQMGCPFPLFKLATSFLHAISSQNQLSPLVPSQEQIGRLILSHLNSGSEQNLNNGTSSFDPTNDSSKVDQKFTQRNDTSQDPGNFLSPPNSIKEVDEFLEKSPSKGQLFQKESSLKKKSRESLPIIKIQKPEEQNTEENSNLFSQAHGQLSNQPQNFEQQSQQVYQEDQDISVREDSESLKITKQMHAQMIEQLHALTVAQLEDAHITEEDIDVLQDIKDNQLKQLTDQLSYLESAHQTILSQFPQLLNSNLSLQHKDQVGDQEKEEEEQTNNLKLKLEKEEEKNKFQNLLNKLKLQQEQISNFRAEQQSQQQNNGQGQSSNHSRNSGMSDTDNEIQNLYHEIKELENKISNYKELNCYSDKVEQRVKQLQEQVITNNHLIESLIQQKQTIHQQNNNLFSPKQQSSLQLINTIPKVSSDPINNNNNISNNVNNNLTKKKKNDLNCDQQISPPMQAIYNNMPVNNIQEIYKNYHSLLNNQQMSNNNFFSNRHHGLVNIQSPSLTNTESLSNQTSQSKKQSRSTLEEAKNYLYQSLCNSPRQMKHTQTQTNNYLKSSKSTSFITSISSPTQQQQYYSKFAQPLKQTQQLSHIAVQQPSRLHNKSEGSEQTQSNCSQKTAQFSKDKAEGLYEQIEYCQKDVYRANKEQTLLFLNTPYKEGNFNFSINQYKNNFLSK